jgi:hypothetical protein
MKRYTILIGLILLLFSCAKKQPEASWLIINKWDLVENNDAINPQGELTHDLNQVFLNMDGEALGAFELPAKVPIIGGGSHNFVLLPGIINNGISATKSRYPFCKKFETTLHLIKNDTIQVTPTTQYYKDLNFLIEDFESPSMNFTPSSESQAMLTRNDDPSILEWGNKYGEIILDNSDSVFAARTNFNTVLPKLATEVYLEIDYRNSNSLLTGVFSSGNGKVYNDPNIQLNPQENPVWKHIYIDLREIISFRQSTPINEMTFTAILDELGTTKYVYLDNIKIIYP